LKLFSCVARVEINFSQPYKQSGHFERLTGHVELVLFEIVNDWPGVFKTVTFTLKPCFNNTRLAFSYSCNISAF
jgi:hypothetical protein